jgi:hypothetical protein
VFDTILFHGWQTKLSCGKREGNFFLFHCAQTGSGAYSVSDPKDIGSSFHDGKSSQRIKVTTHLLLVLRLIMHGAIQSLPTHIHGIMITYKQGCHHGAVLKLYTINLSRMFQNLHIWDH